MHFAWLLIEIHHGASVQSPSAYITEKHCPLWEALARRSRIYMHLNVRVDLATDENELYTRRNERLGKEKERVDSSRTRVHRVADSSMEKNLNFKTPNHRVHRLSVSKPCRCSVSVFKRRFFRGACRQKNIDAAAGQTEKFGKNQRHTRQGWRVGSTFHR